jgi:hypothetical protein
MKYLTDQAVADISRMKARIRALEKLIGDDSTRPLYQTAHFLVETPAAGIPAKDGTVPGQALCNMSRRWGPASPKEIEITSRKIKVYNPTAKVIKGFAIAHRDAYGDYWADDSDPAAECEESPLAPGVYKAFAGAHFGPGESITVYTSANGTDVGETYTGVNQSECTGKLGDRIFLGVSPDCEIFFTPCTCCGDGEGDDDCCDLKVAICICGVQKVISVDGGVGTWDLSECCDCEGASLTITLTCETSGEPPVTTITGSWEYTCGEVSADGVIDLTALCNTDENVELGDLIVIEGCSICDDYRNFVGECEPCPPDEPDEPCVDCPECCGPEWSIPTTLNLKIVSSVCGTLNTTVTQTSGTNWIEGISGSGFCTFSIAEVFCTGGDWGVSVDNESYGVDLIRCTPKLRLSVTGSDGILGTFTIEVDEP